MCKYILLINGWHYIIIYYIIVFLVNLSITILYSNVKYEKLTLEWFLKGHVTLKTQLMAAENVVLPLQEYILFLNILK